MNDQLTNPSAVFFLLDGEPFPVRDGWFVNLGTCETSSCNRIGSRTTLENCKERCMKTPTCTMIKFKSSRGKCSLCESTKFRMPRNGGHCTPGDKYDFYMKGNSAYLLVSYPVGHKCQFQKPVQRCQAIILHCLMQNYWVCSLKCD